MSQGFKGIPFPATLEYRTDNDHVPLEFYISAFPISKSIDMHLGFFNSNAFKVLNSVFAQFIYSGGSMRLVINNILSPEDKENLVLEPDIESIDIVSQIFASLEKLKHEFEGGQHFFDCLKYLIKENRLGIIPVLTRNKSLSHYKNILFYDSHGNTVFTEGSANFTASGILTNGESFNVSRSWGNDPEINRIKKASKRFNSIFNRNHDSYTYLKPEDLKSVINNIGTTKSPEELLINGYDEYQNCVPYKISNLLKEAEEQLFEQVRLIKEEPRFPYENPRRYQVEAYNSWRDNNFQGIFAMATGTGKTLTALLCLIEENKIQKKQKNIFVVPSEELIRQWGEEIRQCNLGNVFLWYSKNSKLKQDIENIKILKNSQKLNIVITYESFKSKVFLSILGGILNQFTIVFDEVHNMGAAGFRDSIKGLEFERLIGLSATPLRLWDEEGENDFIETLFNSFHPDYTFAFPMEDAIGKFLVNYNYYPHFTNLTDDEFEKYLKYTAQIPLGENGEINTTAALKRQLLLDWKNRPT